MTRTKWASCLLSVSMLAACGNQENANVDTVTKTLPTANFCQYATYDFYDFSQIPGGYPGEPEAVANADAIAREAISNEFTALGIAQDSARPDILVNRAYFTNDQIQYEQECIPVGWGYWWGYACGWTTDSYTLGAMVIDLVERVPNELVLRGISNSAVESQGKNLESRITKGVSQVFDTYSAQLTGCPAR